MVQIQSRLCTFAYLLDDGSSSIVFMLGIWIQIQIFCFWYARYFLITCSQQRVKMKMKAPTQNQCTTAHGKTCASTKMFNCQFACLSALVLTYHRTGKKDKKNCRNIAADSLCTFCYCCCLVVVVVFFLNCQTWTWF